MKIGGPSSKAMVYLMSDSEKYCEGKEKGQMKSECAHSVKATFFFIKEGWSNDVPFV